MPGLGIQQMGLIVTSIEVRKDVLPRRLEGEECEHAWKQQKAQFVRTFQGLLLRAGNKMERYGVMVGNFILSSRT